MLKLKLPYFGHLMRRTDSMVKTLMMGKIEDRRRRRHRGWDGWMVLPTWYVVEWKKPNYDNSFSSSHVWMWEWDHKEGWALKNWCFWIVVLKTLESPLDCKEIKPVNPKGNQSWIFIGGTDAEVKLSKTLTTWCKELTSGKDPDVGKDWRQEKKGTTEDEMVEWDHWLNGHEFEETSGDNEGQGSLECCSPWGCKESDMT